MAKYAGTPAATAGGLAHFVSGERRTRGADSSVVGARPNLHRAWLWLAVVALAVLAVMAVSAMAAAGFNWYYLP